MKIHTEEQLPLKDVLSSDNIYITGGNQCIFFLNFDSWDVPVEEKNWYKFSINPYDADFLKFVSIGHNFFDKKTDNVKEFECIIRYLKIFSEAETAHRNSSILYKLFYENGSAKDILEANNIMLTYQYITLIKRTIRYKLYNWLEKIFEEYNELDDTIDYMRDYYNNWITLVDKIQMFPANKYNIIWRFIKKNDIHSVDDFSKIWFHVVEDDVEIRGLSKYDKQLIAVILGKRIINT